MAEPILSYMKNPKIPVETKKEINKKNKIGADIKLKKKKILMTMRRGADGMLKRR